MSPSAADLYTAYLSPEQWMRYAGIWRRLAAAIIDVVMLVFMCFAATIAAIVFLVALPSIERLALQGAGWAPVAVVVLLIAWAYSAGFECSAGQGTIGKTTLGMAVCDGEGQRIGFRQASIRFAGKLLICLSLGVGFALIAFDRRRRGLDDRLAGTVVIERDPLGHFGPVGPSP